ncbi:hypothetical protein J5N97_014835 [Dioscorea zingiberensis]|uniref:PHD finger transcription factor n=1 Tax=Dioscorea zingiberensis TaxID=325984 RepID=A0A9D5CTH4_9LILI|nr:hypothetical protein J5N97_014835 [Dioscorea zingiberensis]
MELGCEAITLVQGWEVKSDVQGWGTQYKAGARDLHAMYKARGMALAGLHYCLELAKCYEEIDVPPPSPATNTGELLSVIKQAGASNRSTTNLDNMGKSWYPVEIEAEQCSRAVDLYPKRSVNAKISYSDKKLKVRQHLASLGWRIEFRKDTMMRKGKQEVPDVDVKVLRLNAKRHLLFMGWNLHFVDKKTKREMCYDSPDGRSYHSLHTACKAYLEELPECTGPSSGGRFKRRKSCRKLVKSVEMNTQGRRPGRPRRLEKSDGRYSDSADEICSTCQEGGTLILCDRCPSAFHLECAGLEVLPEGDWFCPFCRCGICGMSDFNSDTKQFTEKTILRCGQCEREFHAGCLRVSGASGLENCSTGVWFCSEKCSMVFSHLQKLLGKSNRTTVEGLSWTLFRSNRVNGADDVRSSMAKCHGKLRVALDVLHECFVTIIEPRTKSDLVADVVFNKKSDLKRLDFSGFYTMILERGDEIISVATIRVYGDKVAEMPLIGTRVQYRCQGMCRLLVNELEKLLSSLGVEMLLLPAVSQLLPTWTTKFGFTKMTSSDRLKLLDYTLLSFQDTTMCYKPLARNQNQLSDAAALVPVEETNNADTATEFMEIDPIRSSPHVEADYVDSSSASNTETTGQIVPYDADNAVALGNSTTNIPSIEAKPQDLTNNLNVTFKCYYRRWRIFAGNKTQIS